MSETSATIEAVIEQEPTTKTTIADLMQAYNNAKKADTEISAKLADNQTLRGFDKIDEMFASTLLQIEEFVQNGHTKSAIAKTGSKALSLFDTKNGLLKNWFKARATNVKTEEILDSTVPEAIQRLKQNIETKRDEVISVIETAASVRKSMIAKIATYEDIKKEASALLLTFNEHSREAFDAKRLSIMASSTIQQMYNDIKSDIEPLIAAASITVDQIHQILPTFENILQSKLSIKGFQQRLSDLNQMVKGTSDLATNAGRIISEDVNNTVYESLALISETGIDIKAMEDSQKRNFEHQEKIKTLMEKAADKVNSDFKAVAALGDKLLIQQGKHKGSLTEQYANSVVVSHHD